VALQTPNGELVAVPGGRRAFYYNYEMVFEPRILPELSEKSKKAYQ